MLKSVLGYKMKRFLWQGWLVHGTAGPMAIIGEDAYLFPWCSQGPVLPSGPSWPPFTTTLPLPQVSATDEDGPVNSAITYSLVGGNQLGHFTIHPKKGELQVAKALDWEQVGHVGGARPKFIRTEVWSQCKSKELWSALHTDFPDLPSVFHTCFLCVVNVTYEARGKRGTKRPLTSLRRAQASFLFLTSNY